MTYKVLKLPEVPGCPDGPWRCVVEHDSVRDVDVAVGALNVWTQDLALDLFPVRSLCFKSAVAETEPQAVLQLDHHRLGQALSNLSALRKAQIRGEIVGFKKNIILKSKFEFPKLSLRNPGGKLSCLSIGNYE